MIEFHWSTILNSYSLSPQRSAQIFENLGASGLVLGTVSFSLTDGLLVWQCFMVQKIFGNDQPKWTRCFWGFPACLWAVTIVTGLCGTFLSTTPEEPLVPSLGVIAYLSNAVLNLYATVFLTSRLLLYRRMVMISFGESEKALASHHLHLTNILLQSAVVNVPVAVAAAIGIGADQGFGFSTGIPAAPSQALGSILIIQQVAVSRTLARFSVNNTIGPGGENVPNVEVV
ncbi:hypothetical protein D9756_009017 [Leucocoprinus leucothites]|uniref:Uncharacterized protein n=1 Tax=Leucocoprinus leucothites TaxID=201217 RepID=A0A8H5FUT0_9AGAR|nr:hypothetical protein D9756_009017 [Leucoagaricus leucothites]